MTPWRWHCEKWTEERVVTEAARPATPPSNRGVDREGPPGGGAQAILVQRTTRRGSFAPPTRLPSTVQPPPRQQRLWLELKINVQGDQRGLVLVHQGAAPARVGVYFDEAGVLIVDGTTKLPPTDTLQRAISVLRRTAPKLQEIVLDVSRLFAADYWRLDVFLSEMAPLHVNGLTYPAPSDDRRDLVRLANGYTRLSGQADPAPRVPATCALRAISRLLPEEVRYEP